MKRLAPSFGGTVRFIPEKYQQRITKFYSAVMFEQKPRSIPDFRLAARLFHLHFDLNEHTLLLVLVPKGFIAIDDKVKLTRPWVND